MIKYISSAVDYISRIYERMRGRDLHIEGTKNIETKVIGELEI